MKPRWLAFALTLPTDDVLFVQYTVPTIVMSRQCDQHSKVVIQNLYAVHHLFPFLVIPQSAAHCREQRYYRAWLSCICAVCTSSLGLR